MAFSIVTYTDSYFDGVDALWQEAFPNDSAWNAADVSIPEKLKAQPDLLLVAIEEDHVVGSVMAGYDGHRGWISRIAVSRSHRLAGIGQALIQEAEKRLAALGCIKIQPSGCWLERSGHWFLQTGRIRDRTAHQHEQADLQSLSMVYERQPVPH